MEEEKDLVQKAKTDPDAFGKLYDAYYQPIFGFLYRRCGNSEVAKDLTSETFFQALKNIRRYEDRGRPFKSWLYAIASAQAGTYFRAKTRAFPVTTDELPEIAADDGYRPDVQARDEEDARAHKVMAAKARRLIGKLSSVQQSVLSLRFFGGHTVPEIAEQLGMKEGTIKSHIHRALKKLHTLMADARKSPPRA